MENDNHDYYYYFDQNLKMIVSLFSFVLPEHKTYVCRLHFDIRLQLIVIREYVYRGVYLVFVHSFQMAFQVHVFVFGYGRMFVGRAVYEEIPKRVPNQRHRAANVEHQRPIVVGVLEQVSGRTLGDNRTDHVPCDSTRLQLSMYDVRLIRTTR